MLCKILGYLLSFQIGLIFNYQITIIEDTSYQQQLQGLQLASYLLANSCYLSQCSCYTLILSLQSVFLNLQLATYLLTAAILSQCSCQLYINTVIVVSVLKSIATCLKFSKFFEHRQLIIMFLNVSIIYQALNMNLSDVHAL